MSERGDCLAQTDAVVLAGGLGTRLKGVLDDVPKVLAPVGGRPFLAYLLDWLAAFGAKRVVLGLGYKAEMVQAILPEIAPPGVEVVPVVEPEPLGTAGALRNLRPKVASATALVLNGDSFVDADLCAFLEAHARAGADATILCTEVPDASRYGTVEVGGEGRVMRFAEKRAGAGPGVINAGVYAFAAAMFARVASLPGPSLERDVFQALPEGTLAAHCGRFAFLDIGTPEDLARAPAMMARIAGAYAEARP